MKKILLVMMICVMVFALSGCNYRLIDAEWGFDTALIELPGGEAISVEIKSWTDSEGEQLTITSKDGTVYMVSSINCTLIKH